MEMEKNIDVSDFSRIVYSNGNEISMLSFDMRCRNETARALWMALFSEYEPEEGDEVSLEYRVYRDGHEEFFCEFNPAGQTSSPDFFRLDNLKGDPESAFLSPDILDEIKSVMRRKAKAYAGFDFVSDKLRDTGIEVTVTPTETQNGAVPGFTHNGRIFLHPDSLNPDAAVQEYMHIWNGYLKQRNPEFWEEGKKFFRQTVIWNEMKNALDTGGRGVTDDAVMGEILARVCGKFAQEVLNRIASRSKGGIEIEREGKAIDWMNEARLFIEHDPQMNELKSAGQDQKMLVRKLLSEPLDNLANGKLLLEDLRPKKEYVKISSLNTGDTVPDFILPSEKNGGMKLFSGWTVENINKSDGIFLLRSSDGSKKLKLDEKTVERILNPETAYIPEIKPDEIRDSAAVIEGITKLPEFAMLTESGIRTFSGMVARSYSQTEKTWMLENQAGEKITVPENTINVILSDAHREKIERLPEDSPEYGKLLESQYDAYFKPWKNTAGHFRHNLAVYCRREANSPLDAVRIAAGLVKAMPPEERKKTQDILEKMCRKGESVNQIIINDYLEAVKHTPLDSDFILNSRYGRMIARPMYDTVSEPGAKIDADCPLKIGDTIKGMPFKMDKLFSSSGGKEVIRQDCKIIASSKENNTVTLINGDKSFYEVPRDSFLSEFNRHMKNRIREQNPVREDVKKDSGRERKAPQYRLERGIGR